MNFYSLLLVSMYVALVQLHGQGVLASPVTDPTDGFISLPLNSSSFDIHKPYDLPVSERYSVTNGVHKLWVLSTDKPLSPMSPTAPRSEIRIRVLITKNSTISHFFSLCSISSLKEVQAAIASVLKGYDYSSGVWQFEGQAYVPSGPTGVCIMQVFGANRTNTATALMLRIYNGALMYYGARLIEDDIYGRWFRVNVIHDVGTGLLKVFIDGDLKLVAKDRGGASHYFKCGVYGQNYSYFMESLWKDIKVLKLPD